MQTSLQLLVVEGTTGNCVSRRDKSSVRNVFADNLVRQCCCSNASPTSQKLVMNSVQVQLIHSFTMPITFTRLVQAIKLILLLKYEVCAVCFPNLKLNIPPWKRNFTEDTHILETMSGEERWAEKGWPSFRYVLTEHETRALLFCVELCPLSTMGIMRQVAIFLLSPQRDRQGLWPAEDLVIINQLEEASKLKRLN